MSRTPLIQSLEDRAHAQEVQIDNRSPDDNWISNRTTAAVTVACHDMFGNFSMNFPSGNHRESEITKRVTFDVRANVYRQGKHSWNDLKYELGRREKWEVTLEQSELVMRKIGHLTRADGFCIAVFGRPSPLFAPLLAVGILILFLLAIPTMFDRFLPPSLTSGPLSLILGVLTIAAFVLALLLILKRIERRETKPPTS